MGHAAAGSGATALDWPLDSVTDFRALTPLIWEHVNTHGRFELDMATRLPLA
jgi:hypothetical protein